VSTEHEFVNFSACTRFRSICHPIKSHSSQKCYYCSPQKGDHLAELWAQAWLCGKKRM